MNFHAASFGFAALVYGLLSTLLLVSRQSASPGRYLLLASFVSTCWGVAQFALFVDIGAWRFEIAGFSESARTLGWGAFLAALLYRDQGDRDETTGPTRTVLTPFVLRRFRHITILVLLINVALLATSLGALELPIASTSLYSAVWLAGSVVGLLLLELLYRSAPDDRRYAMRHLFFGIGLMFVLDFVTYADSLLFRRVDADLWSARGLVHGLVVPLIGLAVARNPGWSTALHVSRAAVSGSMTLLLAGLYLLATAFAALLIRELQLPGTAVMQIAFVTLALATLATLLLSSSIRQQARVLVSRHFFAYRYDYRLEWQRFTARLAREDVDTPEAILRALVEIVESDAGALFGKETERHVAVLCERAMPGAHAIPLRNLESLQSFLVQTGWIVDLDELRVSPERYRGLSLPPPLSDDPEIWLIVPLPFRHSIVGFVLVGRSRLVKSINWEDRDLLKTAGRQAAIVLAQMLADRALSEAREFTAFSKMSAYTVHELKNILGQQKLLVSNARRHRDKPGFLDSAVDTVDNSVQRMSSLLAQLRSERCDDGTARLEVREIVEGACRQARQRGIDVRLSTDRLCGFVRADSARLLRVLGHLLQNAAEASADDAPVTVVGETHGSDVELRVIDNGSGMSREFIEDRLFRPFETTKGLTGMGVGVFESREYVRTLSGELSVESTPGEGTTFVVALPLDATPPCTENGASNSPDLPTDSAGDATR